MLRQSSFNRKGIKTTLKFVVTVESISIPPINSASKILICFEKLSGGDNSVRSKHVAVNRGTSTVSMNASLELDLSLFAKKDVFGEKEAVLRVFRLNKDQILEEVDVVILPLHIFANNSINGGSNATTDDIFDAVLTRPMKTIPGANMVLKVRAIAEIAESVAVMTALKSTVIAPTVATPAEGVVPSPSNGSQIAKKSPVRRKSVASKMIRSGGDKIVFTLDVLSVRFPPSPNTYSMGVIFEKGEGDISGPVSGDFTVKKWTKSVDVRVSINLTATMYKAGGSYDNKGATVLLMKTHGDQGPVKMADLQLPLHEFINNTIVNKEGGSEFILKKRTSACVSTSAGDIVVEYCLSATPANAEARASLGEVGSSLSSQPMSGEQLTPPALQTPRRSSLSRMFVSDDPTVAAAPETAASPLPVKPMLPANQGPRLSPPPAHAACSDEAVSSKADSDEVAAKHAEEARVAHAAAVAKAVEDSESFSFADKDSKGFQQQNPLAGRSPVKSPAPAQQTASPPGRISADSVLRKKVAAVSSPAPSVADSPSTLLPNLAFTVIHIEYPTKQLSRRVNIRKAFQSMGDAKFTSMDAYSQFLVRFTGHEDLINEVKAMCSDNSTADAVIPLFTDIVAESSQALLEHSQKGNASSSDICSASIEMLKTIERDHPVSEPVECTMFIQLEHYIAGIEQVDAESTPPCLIVAFKPLTGDDINSNLIKLLTDTIIDHNPVTLSIAAVEARVTDGCMRSRGLLTQAFNNVAAYVNTCENLYMEEEGQSHGKGQSASDLADQLEQRETEVAQQSEAQRVIAAAASQQEKEFNEMVEKYNALQDSHELQNLALQQASAHLVEIEEHSKEVEQYHQEREAWYVEQLALQEEKHEHLKVSAGHEEHSRVLSSEEADALADVLEEVRMKSAVLREKEEKLCAVELELADRFKKSEVQRKRHGSRSAAPSPYSPFERDVRSPTPQTIISDLLMGIKDKENLRSQEEMRKDSEISSLRRELSTSVADTRRLQREQDVLTQDKQRINTELLDLREEAEEARKVNHAQIAANASLKRDIDSMQELFDATKQSWTLKMKDFERYEQHYAECVYREFADAATDTDVDHYEAMRLELDPSARRGRSPSTGFAEGASRSKSVDRPKSHAHAHAHPHAYINGSLRSPEEQHQRLKREHDQWLVAELHRVPVDRHAAERHQHIPDADVHSHYTLHRDDMHQNAHVRRSESTPRLVRPGEYRSPSEHPVVGGSTPGVLRSVDTPMQAQRSYSSPTEYDRGGGNVGQSIDDFIKNSVSAKIQVPTQTLLSVGSRPGNSPGSNGASPNVQLPHSPYMLMHDNQYVESAPLSTSKQFVTNPFHASLKANNDGAARPKLQLPNRHGGEHITERLSKKPTKSYNNRLQDDTREGEKPSLHRSGMKFNVNLARVDSSNRY